MKNLVSESINESRNELNLGSMLGIALSAVVGTTLLVWALHFIHISNGYVGVSKPFPRVAVLPFHSMSAAPGDIRSDRALTNSLIGGLALISRVEALPPQEDVDPVKVGREMGVRLMVIGMVERLGKHVRVNIQMISARDGSQLWAARFEGNSDDLTGLSAQIDKALAPHLTALLD